MSGGFSFPPPPPPPPKPEAAADQHGQNYSSGGPQQAGRGGRGRVNAGFQQRGRDTFEPRGRGNFESRGRARGQQRGRGDQRSRGRGNSDNATSHHANGNQRGFWDFGSPPGNSWAGQAPQAPQQWPALYENAPSNLPPGSFVNPNFSISNRLNGTKNTIAPGGYAVGNASAHADHHPTVSRGVHQHTDDGTNETGPQRTSAGYKRKLEALREPQQHREMLPGPQTTPSVPSFGSAILPPVAYTQPGQSQVAAKSVQSSPASRPGAKTLGLTPSNGQAPDYQSDSDQADEEVDEEAQYAELGTKLTFEHNGEMLSLNNEADLAAWKEERRKAWPTMSRVAQKDDEKRRIGEERRTLLADAALMHLDARTNARSSQTWQGRKDRNPPSMNQATGNIERTIETLPVQAGLSQHSQQTSPSRVETEKTAPQRGNAMSDSGKLSASTNAGIMKTSLPGIAADDTEEETGSPSKEPEPDSSSETSSDSPDPDSEDEGPPEISSSKPLASAALGIEKKLCRYFTASGYCRDGDACPFRHELSARAPHTVATRHKEPKQPFDRYAPKLDKPATSERKSIHDRLVEQEQLQEDRLALQAIKCLGQAGFFSLSGLETVDST